MRSSYRRTLVLVGGLAALTCWAMAYSGNAGRSPVGPGPVSPPTPPVKEGIVSLSARLVQDKVHVGGDGAVTLALTLTAGRTPGGGGEGRRPMDVAVVLDRSGSMAEEGKMGNAVQAILGLLPRLLETDRFALVSYADQVQGHGGLLSMTPANRSDLEERVRGMAPNGATNLGAGLQEGIRLLTAGTVPGSGRVSRLILISDGLANRGVTDPSALGSMASAAAERGLGISCIGVGLDFNERLMTSLADRGSGTYYFMESAAAFAGVFDTEIRSSEAVAASSVEIHLPLGPGMALVHAAGYPIQVRDGVAVLRPGDLLSGQTRKLFLTMRVPTGEERSLDLGAPSVHYRTGGGEATTTLDAPLRVTCVRDAGEALASIHKAEWEEKVVQEDYNRLREEVAEAVKGGKREEALKQIEAYTAGQEALNATVGSGVVKSNLDKDVGALRRTVEDSFAGPPAEAAAKRKASSKSLQYEGYQGRRSKN